LLADESLAPGVESWLQIRLEAPLAVAQGDRLILRYPSPPQTIGGGVIVNPHPARRWKRFQDEVIQDLQTRAQGTPAERLAQAANQPEPVPLDMLRSALGLSDVEFDVAVAQAIEDGQVRRFAEESVRGRISLGNEADSADTRPPADRTQRVSFGGAAATRNAARGTS